MTPTPVRRLACVLAAVLLSCAQAACADADRDIALLLAGDAPQIVIDGTRLWSTPVLRLLHASGEVPRWSEARIAALRASIARLTDDGLEPTDFLVEELADLARHTPAARELLATEALARAAFTLRFGKANPVALEPAWNYSRRFGALDPVAWLRDAIAAPDPSAVLQSLRPNGPYYRAMTVGLAALRTTAAAGGWPLLAEGPTIKPGMRDLRVPTLRARLAVDAAATPDDLQYDDALVAAVQVFQQDHGLAADGAVGRATRAALNVPVAARIDQLRVNLERVRWVFRDLGVEFVAVNIASFQAGYFAHGTLRWQGRAIVGRPYRQTPIFRDELSYLELNPTWTVPPTIFREDFLPQLRRDPDFLRRKKLRVVDPNGGPVAAATIDWTQVTAANFRYYLRQDPGPDNALGRIKFMFPNPHAVYLHDTPARELFARAERSFSSGCIRIEHPRELAVQLLDNPARWDLAALNAALDSGKTLRVNLPRKIPILLLYLTAFSDAAGRLQFRRDLYARDAALLAALDAPLAWVPPDDFGSVPAPGAGADIAPDP